MKNWKHNTAIFLGSQTISLLGSYLVQYAIMWHITLTTQSGVMMTIAIICGVLPTFFVSPFAGVWADRYNRKLLIILADIFIALATLILAVLFLLGYKALWLLFVMSAVRALGSGVQSPAIGAFLPQLVPTDKLTQVNAVKATIHSVIALLSPMLSAALLTLAAIEVIFFIDVVTAAVAVCILLAFLHVPVHAKALEGGSVSYLRDLAAGVMYIREHRFIKHLLWFCAVFFILSGPLAFLTPLQVARSFGDEVWRLSAIEITFSTGMIAGGLLMAAWGGFQNKILTMTLSSLMIGACAIALGLIPSFWIYLFIMTLTGVVMPVFNTPFTALLQEKVAGDFLGRVFGVLDMISSTMMPLGMLVFGPAADYIKIEWMLVGTGLLLFIEGFFLMGSKDLLAAGVSSTGGDK